MKLLNSDVFCFGDIWRFEAIHRKRPIFAHPDVFFTWYWTSVHRDGHRILNPDVSPTETRVSVHRDGPKSGISDVCSKNHTFRIHRDAPRTSDSDVSKKRIHRNSTKTSNPDVSIPQKYPKSIEICQNKQPAAIHTPIIKLISAQIIVKYIGKNRQSRCIITSKLPKSIRSN